MAIDPANPGVRIMPADVPQAAATPASTADADGSFGDSLKEAVAEVDRAERWMHATR